jgi:hypothetical protein
MNKILEKLMELEQEIQELKITEETKTEALRKASQLFQLIDEETND